MTIHGRWHRPSIGEALYVAAFVFIPAWLLPNLHLSFGLEGFELPLHVRAILKWGVDNFFILTGLAWLTGSFAGLLVRPLIFAVLYLALNLFYYGHGWEPIEGPQLVAGIAHYFRLMAPQIPTWLIDSGAVFLSALTGGILWRWSFPEQT